jgi:hypothetical protein
MGGVDLLIQRLGDLFLGQIGQQMRDDLALGRCQRILGQRQAVAEQDRRWNQLRLRRA